MTSKIPMMLFSGFFGGQDCVLDIVECFVYSYDPASPDHHLIISSRLNLEYVFPASHAILSPLVVVLLASCGNSQILNPVVACNTVPVIYLVFWHSPIHIQPCKPMKVVAPAINSHLQIPLFIDIPEPISSLVSPASVNNPRKNTGFRIVSANFSKSFLGNGHSDTL